MIWPTMGMAKIVKASVVRRMALGSMAARTDVAAMATPSRTSSQTLWAPSVVKSRTKVASMTPTTAIRALVTLPTGWVVQSLKNSAVDAVITHVFGRVGVSLEAPE